MAGCRDKTTARSSKADGDADEATAASERTGGPISDAMASNGPAERAKAALTSNGSSTGDFDEVDPHQDGDPAPEICCDNADEIEGASFNNVSTKKVKKTTRRQEPPRESEGGGEERVGAPPAEQPVLLAEAPMFVRREGDPLRTKEAERGDGWIRGAAASYGRRGCQDESDGDEEGGLRKTREVVEAEAELMVRMRRCEEERREWETEAMSLRGERQEVLRRLRVLGQEVEEKVSR